jgi:hypothetical protein
MLYWIFNTLLQTCQVLKNFMREDNFLRLVSTGRHDSWRALGKILVPQIARKLPFRGFSSPFFEAQTLCVHAIKIWNVSVPSSQTAKNSAPQAQESPSFLYLFDMRLRHTFSRLLKTSGYTGVGKKNALNIVQLMKRNGSIRNCPTRRNLDKLSLKMREKSHFMRDAWKQTKMREFHGNCGKLGRSASGSPCL